MRAIETFEDLLAELKKYDVQDDPKTGFVAARTFYEERNGQPWPMAPSREVGYVIRWACDGGVFESENLKILSPYTDNFKKFVQTLSYATGDNLMVPNGKSAVSRLITAIQRLHKYGPVDMDRYSSTANEAEKIWTPDMPRKVFMAELIKQFGVTERTIYRRFEVISVKLPKYKDCPWLHAVKSASTRRISNRKKIAKNNNED